MIQRTVPFKVVTPLNGAITPAENTPFKIQNWFSGKYQIKKEKYLNESFGFRNYFIRLANQIAFSLFNKSNNSNIIVGKNKYLFEKAYLDSYYGRDFIGVDSMSHRVNRLKLVNDTLIKLNKNLLLVIAPGKCFYYPEYIPDHFRQQPGITNYNYFLKLIKTTKLNYIDFNQYFIDHKYRSAYDLYPQFGIHWSYYGACIAGDSIIKYIEALRQIDMPNFTWNIMDSGFIKPMDYDLGGLLNLLLALKPGHLVYPRIEFQRDSGKTKPAVLIVGDSFYNSMFDYGIEKCFSRSSFWYYNKKNYPAFYPNSPQNEEINIKQEMDKYDVILLMSTEASLVNLGWGFIDTVYNMFYGIQ
ncbi:MAG: hypothetical protein ABIR66_01085 [Saprospiraceae bacterium]